MIWPFGKSAEERIKEELSRFTGSPDWAVHVEVVKDRAVFTGQVPTGVQKRILETVARGTAGIKGVDTSGVVVTQQEQAAAPASTVEPTRLSGLAIERIRSIPMLQDDPIDVTQRDTVLVLSGAVDNQQEWDAAVTLAKNVPGVTSVDSSGLRIEDDAARRARESLADRTYTVVRGDTLSRIAQRFYGSGSREAYMRIAQANKILDPDRIDVGQVLRIPGQGTPS